MSSTPTEIPGSLSPMEMASVVLRQRPSLPGHDRVGRGCCEATPLGGILPPHTPANGEREHPCDGEHLEQRFLLRPTYPAWSLVVRKRCVNAGAESRRVHQCSATSTMASFLGTSVTRAPRSSRCFPSRRHQDCAVQYLTFSAAIFGRGQWQSTVSFAPVEDLPMTLLENSSSVTILSMCLRKCFSSSHADKDEVLTHCETRDRIAPVFETTTLHWKPTSASRSCRS